MSFIFSKKIVIFFLYVKNWVNWLIYEKGLFLMKTYYYYSYEILHANPLSMYIQQKEPKQQDRIDIYCIVL